MSAPSAAAVLALAWGTVVLLDAATGRLVSLNTLYMIPLCFTTWRFGRAVGLMTGAAAAMATVLINGFGDGLSAQVTAIPPLIAAWNSAMRLMAVGLIVLFVSAFRRAFDRERTDARIDPLTGISNRRGFNIDSARLALAADRDNRRLLYGVIDIDDFKRINDNHGHEAGDRVLRTLATALATVTRPYDAVGRLGGDEFAFCLAVRDASAGERKCRNIHQRITEALANVNPPATCTLGATAGSDRETCIADADRALYDAKRLGKKSWLCYPNDAEASASLSGSSLKRTRAGFVLPSP
ncbi:MAG: GGDEF domain-containing protein [Janthinobacterium lividum]